MNLLIQFGQVPSNFIIGFNILLSMNKVVDYQKVILHCHSPY